MSTYDDILGSALSKFSKLVKKPERYIKPDNELLQEIKLLSKAHTQFRSLTLALIVFYL